MNYIIAGMIHAGIDLSHVVSFLSTCYIPPVGPNTFKKKKEICASLKDGLQSRVLLCTQSEKQINTTKGLSRVLLEYGRPEDIDDSIHAV